DGKVRAVVDARPEAVAPARSEVQARTLASIQKAEQLVRVRILALLLEIEIQTVLVAQRRVEPHSDVVAVTRVRNHEAVVLYDTGVGGVREIREQPRRGPVEPRRGNYVVGKRCA